MKGQTLHSLYVKTTVVVQRADFASPEAQALVHALNTELKAIYPEQGATHFQLDPEELAEGRGAFFIASIGGRAAGCGAIRRIAGDTGEIKRMYVVPELRGRGISRRVLSVLEAEGRRLGLTRLVLETGARQAAAIALYERAGFRPTAPFGEYVGSPLSVCMEKTL